MLKSAEEVALAVRSSLASSRRFEGCIIHRWACNKVTVKRPLTGSPRRWRGRRGRMLQFLSHRLPQRSDPSTGFRGKMRRRSL